MSTFRDWKVVNKLSDRGQTNSEVHLLQKKDSDEFIVRKVIHGIDHPLYQAIFTREMRALYKLNKSENIVSIVGDDYLKETKTGEKVGVIYLEYINGVELGKCNLLEYLTQRDIQTKNSGVNVRYRGKHRFFKGFNEFIKEKTRRCDNDFEKIERHVFF